MLSRALNWWKTDAQITLDNMRAVHALVGGRGPGRRYATGQINNAYVVLLSSQFQKFCRDLHSQAADHIASMIPATLPWSFRPVVMARFTDGRKLDRGNATPGNLGIDFDRFGFDFWQALEIADPRNLERNKKLEQLNVWRNAIGHHDFSKAECGGRVAVRLYEVTDWRRTCDALAGQFDTVLCGHLKSLTGAIPW